MDALAKKLLPEARRELAEAKAKLADAKWVERNDSYMKGIYEREVTLTPEQLAGEKARYLELRAKGGNDTSAMMEYTRLMKPVKAEAYKHFHGWLIARMLIDDDGVQKPFAFYPREFYGKPPYFYATKPQAQKALEKLRREGRFESSELVVVKYVPRMYLNRY